MYTVYMFESNYVDQTNAIIYLHLQRFEIRSTPEALRGSSHVVLTFNIAPLCSGNKYQDGLSLCRNCQVKEKSALYDTDSNDHIPEPILWIFLILEHVSVTMFTGKRMNILNILE